MDLPEAKKPVNPGAGGGGRHPDGSRVERDIGQSGEGDAEFSGPGLLWPESDGT